MAWEPDTDTAPTAALGGARAARRRLGSFRTADASDDSVEATEKAPTAALAGARAVARRTRKSFWLVAASADSEDIVTVTATAVAATATAVVPPTTTAATPAVFAEEGAVFWSFDAGFSLGAIPLAVRGASRTSVTGSFGTVAVDAFEIVETVDAVDTLLWSGAAFVVDVHEDRVGSLTKGALFLSEIVLESKLLTPMGGGDFTNAAACFPSAIELGGCFKRGGAAGLMEAVGIGFVTAGEGGLLRLDPLFDDEVENRVESGGSIVCTDTEVTAVVVLLLLLLVTALDDPLRAPFVFLVDPTKLAPFAKL